jgi:hypothetical protein
MAMTSSLVSYLSVLLLSTMLVFFCVVAAVGADQMQRQPWH